MLINVLLLVFSLYGVIKATDWFLSSSETIGVKLRLSPFILGVLLVGFGTSLPELATSITAVLNQTDNIAIANIIGSNMANILVIIGIATFFLGTISFDKDLIDLDLPHLLGVTVLFAILIVDGQLNFTDGIILLVGFVVYLLYSLTYRENRAYRRGLVHLIGSLARTGGSKTKPKSSSTKNTTLATIVLITSIAILLLSSKVAVDSLLSIANSLNLQIDVVTFVTIALGTSLPELSISFKALKAGKGDVVLGNIIGSCIFNILLVGGVASTLSTQFIGADILAWSVAGLVIASVLLVINGVTRQIHVWEGAVFILVYIALVSNIIA